MELTSPLNVENATRNTKPSIILPVNAQNQYKKRHDTVARAVHFNLFRKYQIPCSNKWYEHQPQPVTENENAKLHWDYSIRTDRVIPAY